MTLENSVFILIAILLPIEIFRGAYRKEKMSGNDWLINVLSFLTESLTRPLFAFAIAYLLAQMIPSSKGALAELPFWPTLIAFFFLQDFIHYWYHRLAHEWPSLWNIHRVHHSANHMSILVNSRINFLWQLLMPVNYVSGLAIYLGLTEIFVVWWAFRAWLNFLTHTEIRWDLPLYNIAALKPLVWAVEHLLTTPDAHHAHHAFGKNGMPMGNYAPVMIFWDFVFGTAKLPHRAQEHIGIQDDPNYPWYQQLFWPVFRFRSTKDSQSQ